MMEKNESLYVPSMERDSCGIGFVAHIHGQKSHRILKDALSMLINMEHRGGCGCEPETGDGAGVLFQIPHQFFAEETKRLQINLPDAGNYGVGMVFFPRDRESTTTLKSQFNQLARQLSLKILGYRQVPSDNSLIGETAKEHEPYIEQVFISASEDLSPTELDRKLFVLRKAFSHQAKSIHSSDGEFYIASLSSQVIIYKGQLRTDQLAAYYPDLSDPRVISALAVIHSRFSTNTFPKWKLAQPFRYIAHNGEINTVLGNVNNMKSKEALLQSAYFSKEEIAMMLPILSREDSDSANLDSMVELLLMSGRSLPHVMMMLIPEAWQDNQAMSEERKAFYKYHACLMEPWDGPASISFTDGKMVGATLDRNGLRPSRYCVTDEDIVIMASEAGALPVEQSKVKYKGRLQPGRMFIVNMEQGRIVSDEEVKNEIISSKPYLDWIKKHRIKLRLEKSEHYDIHHYAGQELLNTQFAFGYTSEELKVIVAKMAETGKEPVGSMGSDTPLAVLSEQSQHLSSYFKQLFAQVSNPPIDPIRERSVMSLFTQLGASLNILDETELHCRQVHINQPILSESDLDKIKRLKTKGYDHKIISMLFDADYHTGGLKSALDDICKQAEKAVRDGCSVVILSDRGVDSKQAPVPALLATGAVHHHLIRKKLRANCGLVVETGDCRETHHFATLIGYGASAICPYLALDSIRAMKSEGKLSDDFTADQAIENFIDGINYGLLKILSKMGISTLHSYQGAQIFEIIGLHPEVVDFCFEDTVSRISGLTFDDLAAEVLIRHQSAFHKDQPSSLEVGGVYQWKRRGEYHLFNPETIHLLQHSSRKNDFSLYKKYAQHINDQTRKACTLRGLLDFEFSSSQSIPIEEVEPAEEIFKRFATGAMSFGSISHEAHSTLAVAMNRIGGKSNSGEGGEDEVRFEKKTNGDWERSAIKQVASGRFGVTSHYLANADEIQIKMAQGAKPGEGGQLPGHKVDEWIGRVRNSTPGVGLISPPPHHDIYSIEDLAQLIFDLKNANRDARINVKLVSKAGVGTIAAGVAKAMADVVLISGADGGTGASPLSSIKHAGLPWELGVAETHQTLVKNKLRSRITVQTDGQIRTGRDLAIATLLGAEEWGVATAALVVEGCIMMRKCHLNTCPVGIATQDPDLRKLFTGKPEEVVNFFRFLAEDLREIMAELGFRTVNEMVGQSHLLKPRTDLGHWKLKTLDLSPILFQAPTPEGETNYKSIEQAHEIDTVLDRKLIKAAKPALTKGKSVFMELPIVNTDRALGAMLSHEVSKKYKGAGLPDKTIHFKFRGSAGQSFGVFAAKGILLELEGEANDYFGKGLSGAQLVVYPDKESGFSAGENIIVGNVAFYGATSGFAYINGTAGERFAVRNSGMHAVVEGVGDHCCEYMTGGRVVILGQTGNNFAAGMSGGIAYILDLEDSFADKCNQEMVDLETLDAEDDQYIRDQIRIHCDHTGSEVGERVLGDWAFYSQKFVKVMPREYRAVLEKRKDKNKVEA